MMDKEIAIEIKSKTLDTIAQLSELLLYCEKTCASNEYESIRKGIGLTIGRLQSSILDLVYCKFPELDELDP